MAVKQFKKKKTGVKKKKTVLSKKTGGSSAVKKLNAIVAGEVQKALKYGIHNEKRKLTMDLSLVETQVFINGKQAFNNCIRIPITAAIPAQGSVPDIRRRQSNKILVTGVNVRASLAVSDQTRVMLFPYEPHESVKKYIDAVSLEVVPSAAQGYVPERFATA